MGFAKRHSKEISTSDVIKVSCCCIYSHNIAQEEPHFEKMDI